MSLSELSTLVELVKTFASTQLTPSAVFCAVLCSWCSMCKPLFLSCMYYCFLLITLQAITIQQQKAHSFCRFHDTCQNWPVTLHSSRIIVFMDVFGDLAYFLLICLASVFGSDCFINVGGISFGRDCEQTAAHLLVCIYLLFKTGSGCMELLGACFWTNCTTATKQTQQTVLQQRRKPNRLYYSNKANPTDCTTATKQTQPTSKYLFTVSGKLAWSCWGLFSRLCEKISDVSQNGCGFCCCYYFLTKFIFLSC